MIAAPAKMTKRFEFNWQIEVPEGLRTGCICDRWFEEKDNTDLELNCMFNVDEYGFFIYWQSEGKVRYCERIGNILSRDVTVWENRPRHIILKLSWSEKFPILRFNIPLKLFINSVERCN